MKFCVYVIKSQTTGKIYTGHTNNLKVRLLRHNGKLPNKKSSFTSKNSGPWAIVYTETHSNRAGAKIREYELKSGRGRDFLKKFLSNNRP